MAFGVEKWQRCNRKMTKQYVVKECVHVKPKKSKYRMASEPQGKKNEEE